MKKSEYNKFVDLYQRKKCSFTIESKRNSHTLIMNKKRILTYRKSAKSINKKGQSKPKVISLIGQVSQSVNRFIIKSGFDIIEIKQKNTPFYNNKMLWNELKTGEDFFYVDIKHCYWRIAYLFGYIGEALYQNVLKKKDLKLYRNMALACIIAPKRRKYYINGEMILEIEEDKHLYRIIYDNIRFTAYNLVGDIQREFPEYIIGYRTDGLLVKEDVLAEVNDFILNNNFETNINRCKKINNSEYEAYMDDNSVAIRRFC